MISPIQHQHRSKQKKGRPALSVWCPTLAPWIYCSPSRPFLGFGGRVVFGWVCWMIFVVFLTFGLGFLLVSLKKYGGLPKRRLVFWDTFEGLAFFAKAFVATGWSLMLSGLQQIRDPLDLWEVGRSGGFCLLLLEVQRDHEMFSVFCVVWSHSGDVLPGVLSGELVLKQPKPSPLNSTKGPRTEQLKHPSATKKKFGKKKNSQTHRKTSEIHYSPFPKKQWSAPGEQLPNGHRKRATWFMCEHGASTDVLLCGVSSFLVVSMCSVWFCGWFIAGLVFSLSTLVVWWFSGAQRSFDDVWWFDSLTIILFGVSQWPGLLS